MTTPTFPPFEAHPLLRNGHLQTLTTLFRDGTNHNWCTQQHQVTLEDGDRIVLHDDCPAAWQPNDRSAMIVHGLGGSSQAYYMQRLAARLNQHHVRTFRMDLRRSGAGIAMARLPSHAGRSTDIATAIRYVAKRCPQSPTSLIGYSLGGNIVLKLLGEIGHEPFGNLDNAAAICPPIDLAACIKKLSQIRNRFYDRYLASQLLEQTQKNQTLRPDAPPLDFPHTPNRVGEFDEMYTAPVCGFRNAADYYQQCSSQKFIPDIKIHTLIVADRDDPLVPIEPFEYVPVPPTVHLERTTHGGHLGYISRSGLNPNRRWLDWRILHWVTTETPA